MADAIATALLFLPEPGAVGPTAKARQALVLCTTEHGFVGGFNERILDAAETLLDSGVALFVMGSRGAAAARERGWSIEWVSPMATRSEGVPETIRQLTAELYVWLARADLARIEVMFTRHRQSTGTTIERKLLFPVDLKSLAVARMQLSPLHNLARAKMVEKLIADYVVGLVTEAAIDAIASENAVRFQTMGAALE